MITVGGYVSKYLVKKLKKHLWYYVLDLGKDESGKRIQNRTRGFESEAAAKKALTQAKADAYNGTYVKPTKLIFGEYINEWFKGKKNTIGVQTASVYETNIRIHIVPSLGSVELSKLTTPNIKKFINDLVDKGLSPGTIKKIYNVITASLNDAVEEGVVQKNVALAVNGNCQTSCRRSIEYV